MFQVVWIIVSIGFLSVQARAAGFDGFENILAEDACEAALDKINKEKDILISVDEQGASLIHYIAGAAACNILNRIKLIYYPHDTSFVFFVDNEKKTPLHYAAQSTSPRAGQTIFLLQRIGADLNAQDTHGCTALMYAVAVGNMASIETLLMYDASINIKDFEHRTAFDYTKDPAVSALLYDYSTLRYY